MTLPGCAYIRDDAPTDAPLPPSAKAKIDGDLVYFNWADYLAPSVVKGFQEEYGVKVIESNYDSMEGMYAKIAAGNEYDIVFPIAKWVVKLKREGKIRSIDPAQLKNADQVFYSGSYFNEPWYDARSEASVPFTVYKTGIGWRTDKVSTMTGSWHDLWNDEARGQIFTLDDQDEALAMAAILLGYDVNTAEDVGARRHEGPADQPEGVPPGLLLRRHQQHGRRRRLGAPHVERRLPLPEELGGRRPDHSRLRGTRRGHARSTPTPMRSRPTPSTRARRWSSSTTCSGPRTPSRT